MMDPEDHWNEVFLDRMSESQTITEEPEMSRPKKYNLGSFIVDCILTVLTGGIWFLYKIFRALSN